MKKKAKGAPCSLERIGIDRQGYDRRGRYWGVGAPLYRYECGGDGGHVRARNREAAKSKIRQVERSRLGPLRFPRSS